MTTRTYPTNQILHINTSTYIHPLTNISLDPTHPMKVLGHGASGEVVLVTHKVTKKTFACKVVRKDTKMNDAQSMSTEVTNITSIPSQPATIFHMR